MAYQNGKERGKQDRTLEHFGINIYIKKANELQQHWNVKQANLLSGISYSYDWIHDYYVLVTNFLCVTYVFTVSTD